LANLLQALTGEDPLDTFALLTALDIRNRQKSLRAEGAAVEGVATLLNLENGNSEPLHGGPILALQLRDLLNEFRGR
jgi:hypothetical protein